MTRRSKHDVDEPDNGPTGDPDPLALSVWPSQSRSPLETEERRQFEAAWQTFLQGDFRATVTQAQSLIDRATSDEVRARAAALQARLRPDPAALGVGLVLFVLILAAVLSTCG